MRISHHSVIFVAVILLLNLTQQSLAQDVASVLVATERLEKLKTQLRDAKAQEADLQERIRKLEIDLQPENLQRAIHQIGTLKPDELRDERRRQLEKEKAKVQEQLTALTESRLNLEKTIGEADLEIERLKAAAATKKSPSGDANDISVAAPEAASPPPVTITSPKRSSQLKRNTARRTSRRNTRPRAQSP